MVGVFALMTYWVSTRWQSKGEKIARMLGVGVEQKREL